MSERPLDLLVAALRVGSACPGPDPTELDADTGREIARLAAEHQVAPLLYRAWTDRLPAGPVLGELAGWYHRTTHDNLRRFHELRSILQAFGDAEIDVIVLKGAHLAATVYESMALRPMDDLDLLVRHEQIEASQEILLKLGYESDPSDHWLSFPGHHHLRPFLAAGRSPVEVHWDLVQGTRPIAVDVAGLWERARPATIADVETRALAPEDLLLHLCVHEALVHRFQSGIRPLIDIAVVTREWEASIDWKVVPGRAEAWAATGPVFLSLFFAHHFLGATVDEATLATLRPPEADVDRLASIGAEYFGPDRPPLTHRSLACLQSDRPLAQKIRIVLRRLRGALRHPARLPATIKRQAPVAWRLIRGNAEARSELELDDGEWQVRELSR